MISAYEHGGNAARHGKHIQACPFNSGTTQWREWRSGFIAGVALTDIAFEPVSSNRSLRCGETEFSGQRRPKRPWRFKDAGAETKYLARQLRQFGANRRIRHE